MKVLEGKIRRLSKLAKPSPAADYDLVLRGDPPPAQSVVQAASTWLSVHISSGNECLIAVMPLEEGYWFFRAEMDFGTDNAGRPLAHVIFGEVADSIEPSELTRLMFGAYKEQLPSRSAQDPCIVTLAKESEPNHEEVADALVGLAIGATRCPVVKSSASASLVMEMLSDRIAYVILMPRSLPNQWPDGLGIALCQELWQVPDLVRQLSISYQELNTIDLPGLVDLKSVPEEKGEWLKRGLSLKNDITIEEPGENLELLDWLLDTPGGRLFALKKASYSLILRWVSQQKLRRDDLEEIKSCLSKSDSRTISNALGKSVSDLKWFLGVFGPGADGIESVLPESAVSLLQRIRLSEEEPLREVSLSDEKSMELLQEAGLLSTLKVAEKAALMSSPLKEWIEPVFYEDMMREGMTDVLYSYLIKRDCDETRVSDADLDVLPVTEWLRVVDYERLWTLGEQICPTRKGRHWWEDALENHPHRDSSKLPVQNAPWSPSVGEWFCGKVRDYELSPEAIIKKLPTWWIAIGFDEGWRGRILRLAGFSAHWRVLDLSNGRVPRGEPTPLDIETIEYLLRARVLKEGQLVQLVSRGASPNWLNAAFPSNIVSFLNIKDQLPAVVPGLQWSPLLNILLARACQHVDFWNRFEGQLTQEVVEWIAQKFKNSPRKNILELRRAYQDRQRLSLKVLKLVIRALPAKHICIQIAVWSSSTYGRDRHEAMNLLVSAKVLAPNLREWLQVELLTCGVTPPLPRLTNELRRELMSVLHLTRDILRPLLAEQNAEPDEEEFAAILAKRIEQMGEKAIPLPSEEVAQRHLALVAHIAKIPGWEVWGESIGDVCE